MATESDVDISGAHPYWAYPFADIAVVHNGQLTNYFQWKRRLERSGHRFQSECDSEIIAVYLAQKMSDGLSLEDAMNASLDDLDGVFTYICVTGEALALAAASIACLTDPAVPTTLSCGSSPSSAARPSTIKRWSSTIRTVMGSAN